MSSLTDQLDPAQALRPLRRRPGDSRLTAADLEPAAALDWPAVTDAFRAGDAAAAEVVATHVLPYIAQLVRQLNAWGADHDDLVQDILVTALARRQAFRGDARLETWLTRIAINVCRAHGRRQWLRRRLFARWQAERRQPDAPAAAELASDDEQARRVQQAIAELPGKYREAIVLYYLRDLTAAEAAAALGISPTAMEKRLSRAREQLTQRLAMRSPSQPANR